MSKQPDLAPVEHDEDDALEEEQDDGRSGGQGLLAQLVRADGQWLP